MTAGRILSTLLVPLSWLFGSVVWLRNSSYDRGLARIRRLPVPVISVGNLSVGGTGKTPVVALLARRLSEAGCRPAVVLRGYGGSNARRSGGPPLLVADGRRTPPLADAITAGDEAVLLASTLESVPVIVAADRYQGGMEAVRSCNAGMILLDDGFQHRALHRDVDLLTMDASAAPFPGRLLPAGRLREPARSLGRSHGVILTRADDEEDYRRARDFIRRQIPGLPIYRSRHRPARLCWLAPVGGEAPSLVDLRDLPVAAFAGLARPEALRDTLAGLGARVVQFTPLPDHHRFRPGQVERLVASGQAAGARLVITTAKDAARLPSDQAPPHLAVLEIQVEMDGLGDLMARLTGLLEDFTGVEGSR